MNIIVIQELKDGMTEAAIEAAQHQILSGGERWQACLTMDDARI